MKCIALLLLLALSSCAAVEPDTGEKLSAASFANHATVYVGGRKLDSSDWSPVDMQSVFAAEYSRRANKVGWEVGVQFARDEADEIDGAENELYGGLRFELTETVVRPYFGLGATVIEAKREDASGDEDDDSTLGTYFHVGFTVDLNLRLYLGLDARWVFGSDFELFGVEHDSDYAQIALALGFAF